MESLNSIIESHYYKAELYEDIIERLEEQEISLSKVTRNNIAGVDELHVRGAEVSRELAKEINLDNADVLDVGCGIGGPSRMLADDFNCRVTGIDISQEFVRTAKRLSELVGLGNKTTFMKADALDLPFADGSFDVVWTQHVQMNISQKTEFYTEIKRVLKARGTLLYYDIFKKDGQDVNYPVPWAEDSSMSFLQTIANMDKILVDLGFTRIRTIDQTAKATQFLLGLFEKIRLNGLPKLGLNVLMGDSTKEKLNNILKGIEENKIVLQSGIYKI